MQTRDLAAELGQEWLLTAGNGGYASGRAMGPRSRSYHGLFVAALPAPLDRVLVLAQVDESVRLRDQTELLLATHRYEGGHQYPDGSRHLESVAYLNGGMEWRWREADFVLEKRLEIGPGNRGRLTWTLGAAGVERISLRPYVAFRSHHGGESAAITASFDEVGRAVVFRFADQEEVFELRTNTGVIRPSVLTQERVLLLDEEARGLKAVEALQSQIEIDWFMPEPGDQLVMDFELQAGLPATPERPMPRLQEGLLGQLSRAMLDFLIFHPADLRPGVIAGYPWFNEWGRDTMIALPGLSLALADEDLPLEILVAWAERCRSGLLPNRLAEGAGEAAYNSVDAPLWFWRALTRWGRQRGGLQHLPQVLRRSALEILSAYHEGTDFGIGVDPDDGLLMNGDANSHLTWMDAFVAGTAITPRYGKCVELQALYVEALSAAIDLGLDPAQAGVWRERARRLSESFRRRFLGAAFGSLEDCVDGDASRLRPNQLFALASNALPLTKKERAEAFATVAQKLWTPRGPRSLAADDDAYLGHYGGGPLERDRAYHQGTVWAWLTGAFIDASMHSEDLAPAELRRHNEARVAQVLGDLNAGMLGQLAEIFSGDEPQNAGGAPAQAWSVAEILRVIHDHCLDSRKISQLMGPNSAVLFTIKK